MLRDTRCHFFFQAEDGIRDYKVTGVQTCALPISEAEALAEVAPVAAISQTAPQKHGADDRSGEIDGEEIDESQAAPGAFRSPAARARQSSRGNRRAGRASRPRRNAPAAAPR